MNIAIPKSCHDRYDSATYLSAVPRYCTRVLVFDYDHLVTADVIYLSVSYFADAATRLEQRLHMKLGCVVNKTQINF